MFLETLPGFLLHLENWFVDKDVAALGWGLFTGGELFKKPEASVTEATWMVEKGSLSKSVYQEYRMRFADRMTFPPVNHVRRDKQLYRPPLTEYMHGVRAPLLTCLTLTLADRLTYIDFSSLDQSSLSYSFKMCWGLDGSGDHKSYHQLSKTKFTTKQVMSVCYTIKEVKVKDQLGKVVSWSSSTAGANKPGNTRPLLLFPGKESVELVKEVVPMVEEEVKQVKEEGVKVKLEGVEVKVKCEAANMSMVDGKMVAALLQLGGCYCTMCTSSLEDCHRLATINQGFLIDRSVEQLATLAKSLTNPETGEITKRKADYETRQGVCGAPITSSDLTKVIPVCHSKICSFNFIIELLTRYNSHQKWSTPSNQVKFTEEEKKEQTAAREMVKETLWDNFAINIGTTFLNCKVMRAFKLSVDLKQPSIMFHYSLK